ncbi:S9 family peptidase [Neiella marina]|uniref:S9 family peptidase n=1 Tax=Neiella holothuriorum TaxID=2870530 RepID=A0ABS7EIJ8_9GAMM|nr:S9 family peptidase [Neiella holothuriorum]MBW8192177.1 S9 family peptidase [Neiella holothuriorum]
MMAHSIYRTLFLVTLLWLPLSTQANQPIPLEAFGTLPAKTMMVMSPSAKRLAYRDTSGGKDVLTVVDLSKGGVIAALDLSNIRTDGLYFLNEDKIVIRSTQHRRIMGYTGQHDVSSAFLLDINTNKIQQMLTPGKGIHAGQGGLGRIVALSSDHKSVYMPAYLINKRNPGKPPFGLVRVKLDAPKRTPKVVQKGSSTAIDFFLDENDEILARERYDEAADRHLIETFDGLNWNIIYEEKTSYINKGFAGITPDYKALVMSATAENGHRAYYRLELADGAINGPIFARENASVASLITNTDRVVAGVRYAGFQPSYEFFDDKLTRLFAAINNAMPNDSLNLVDYTPDWNSLLFYVEGEGIPGEYYMFNGGNFTYLATSRPQLQPTDVNPVEIYSYQARDGLTIPALLTRPAQSDKAKPLPAIMLPHGGPESYDKKGFDWLAQYFASRGFLVIQPQYRGSTGFGAQHVLKGRGEWGKKMQDDLTDAITALSEQGRVEPNRVCIVGASYGGYAALAGATLTPDMYQCAVSINGVSDLETMMDRVKRESGRKSGVHAYWEDAMAGGNATDDYLEAVSPINHVAQTKAPVLLIHGTIDEVVNIEQSKDMYKALRKQGKDVTYLELEDEGHYLSKSSTRLQALQAIDAFIEKYMM